MNGDVVFVMLMMMAFDSWTKMIMTFSYSFSVALSPFLLLPVVPYFNLIVDQRLSALLKNALKLLFIIVLFMYFMCPQPALISLGDANAVRCYT